MQATPRNFSEVLSDGMRMLGAVWRSLIAPSLAAFIPMGALTLGAFQATGGTEFLRLSLERPGRTRVHDPRGVPRDGPPFRPAF